MLNPLQIAYAILAEDRLSAYGHPADRVLSHLLRDDAASIIELLRPLTERCDCSPSVYAPGHADHCIRHVARRLLGDES